MGEKSRAKIERRIAIAAVAAAEAQRKISKLEETNKPVSALTYVRSVGGASILFGAVGTASAFFWPSVGLLYCGLLTLVTDLYLERLRLSIKAIILVILMSAGCFYAKYVVFRIDPIRVGFLGYVSENDHGLLNLFILNETAQDYTALDFHMILPNENWIIFARHSGYLSSCAVFPIKQGFGLNGEHSLIGPNPVTHMVDQLAGNYVRVRCDVLPHYSSLQLVISVKTGDKLDGVPSGHPHIELRGDYMGKFRKFSLPKEVPIITDQSGGWTQNEMPRTPRSTR